MDVLELAQGRGVGRAFRIVLRIIFVRLLFGTFGFAGGIVILIALAAFLWFMYQRNR